MTPRPEEACAVALSFKKSKFNDKNVKNPIFYFNYFSLKFSFFPNCGPHRRRINTKEKAHVVDAAWGIELIQFLVTL